MTRTLSRIWWDTARDLLARWNVDVDAADVQDLAECLERAWNDWRDSHLEALLQASIKREEAR